MWELGMAHDSDSLLTDFFFFTQLHGDIYTIVCVNGAAVIGIILQECEGSPRGL